MCIIKYRMQSEHFITNSGEKSLSKILNGILPKSDALDFLVGYFYFSGINEIREFIGDKKMRILVGMEIEKELLNISAEFDFFQRKQLSSKQEIRYDYYQRFTSFFNHTDFFETKQQQEVFKIYFNKIKDGTLEIRKTKEPCHAKMYIFTFKDDYSEDGENLGNVITGSSNLTYNGLRGQNEINVRFKNNPEYKDALQIFETLWQYATVIADKERIDDFIEGVITKIWLDKYPAPYLMYLRCLYEYFNIDTSKRIRTPHDITKGKFMNLKYQEDAVRLAIKTLEKHSGVIVSDVVGLGKSIIGSTVANNLNLRTIVVAPPHLVPQWEDYMNEFRVSYSVVFSRGLIEKALDYYRDKTMKNEKWLIIIDEAHNYRNEFTQDYGMLHELCQGNLVELLTATPFNNQPSDIYAMLKLFQIPTKSTLKTVNNLGIDFRELIIKYQKLKKQQKDKEISGEALKREIELIAKRIRDIIHPLVIRRSRLDLEAIPDYKKDLKLQKIEFPVVADPQLLEYDLGNLHDIYFSTLQKIHTEQAENEDDPDIITFRATRYKSILYVKDEFQKKVAEEVEETGIDYNLLKGRQRNLSKFMRSMLVRRFESSQYAFRISLDNMLQNCMNIKKWAETRSTVPIFKKGFLPDIEEMYDSSADSDFDMYDIEEDIEKLKSRGLFELKTKFLHESFFEDLDMDIDVLQQLKSEWDHIEKDPKTDAFIKILKQKLSDEPARKIIIFTQFADTAVYLEKILLQAGFPVFAYTSRKANETNKNIIRRNFDAGIDVKKQNNDFQILIATDAISEGYNLHRAGAIFNYDIPYNPTRVIQRIGRINRINKKMFDKLFVFNYFPTNIGEAETRTKEISTLKMAMIHAIMGEDTKVLTHDEQLQSFFAEQYKNLIHNDEKLSWDSEYRTELNALIGTKDMDEALKIHPRSKIRRRTSLSEEGMLVVAHKKDDLVFLFVEPEKKPQVIYAEKAFRLLKTDSEEKAYPLSDRFDDTFILAKKALFAVENEGENEKQKREALEKVLLMIQKKACDLDFLEDLKTAIQRDAISGFHLREINRLKPKEYARLPEIVSSDYIRKMLQTYDNLEPGAKTLILVEEIESNAVNSDTQPVGSYLD